MSRGLACWWQPNISKESGDDQSYYVVTCEQHERLYKMSTVIVVETPESSTDVATVLVQFET